MNQPCRDKINKVFLNSIKELRVQSLVFVNVQEEQTDEEDDYCFVPGYN